jgi:hypothetical protein
MSQESINLGLSNSRDISSPGDSSSLRQHSVAASTGTGHRRHDSTDDLIGRPFVRSSFSNYWSQPPDLLPLDDQNRSGFGSKDLPPASSDIDFAGDVSDIRPSVLSKEWIPPMLRLPTSIALSTTFLFCIVVLETLDVLDRKHHGFAVSPNLKTLARYLPTIIVVLLAFIWEMLLRNLKLVGPWSLMRSGWAKAEEALVEANYVDAVDTTSVYKSFTRRQYGIALGYVGALLCGGLVPFANNLFFTDPIPRVTTTPQSLIRTSRLVPNDTLTGNGGLALNSSFFDPQAFLNYLTINRMDYAYPDWTTNEHAFESFNLSIASISSLESTANQTISASTSAFNVDVACDPVTWRFYNGSVAKGSDTGQFRLEPDSADLAKANCHIFPADYPRLSFEPANVTAWINYTTCGDWQCSSAWSKPVNPKYNCGDNDKSDLRLTVNVWKPDPTINSSRLANSSATVSSLLCKINTSLDQYDVQVDARTAKFVSIGSRPISSKAITIANPESIVLKINQYLKKSNGGTYTGNRPENDKHFPLEAFLDKPWTEMYGAQLSEYFDNGEIGYYPGAVRPGANPLNYIDVDKVIMMFARGDLNRIAGYTQNIALLSNELSTFLRQLVSQIVHLDYRLPDQSIIQGTVTTSIFVIRLRQVALRVLEGILAALMITTIMTSTLLRPRTDLRSDPGTLGAIGLIVADSVGLDLHLQGTERMNEQSFLLAMKGSFVKTVIDGGRTKILWRSDTNGKKTDTISKAENRPYRQTVLHLGYRIALFLSISIMIAALGVSWWRNNKDSGYAARNKEETYLAIFLPSTLLVILGYAIQAVDSAIQSLQPYIRLQKKSLPAKVSLGFNPMNHSIFTIGFKSLREAKSPLLFATSLTRFLLPTIKIVAAALFVSELRPCKEMSQLSLDSSLISNLDTYSLGYFDGMNDLLRTRATVLTQFAPTDKSSLATPGIADGLVFSNISNIIESGTTNQVLDSGSEIELRIPAVHIVPDCVTFATSDYGTVTPTLDAEEDPIIKVVCNEGIQKCPSSTLDTSFNTSDTASGDAIEYYWNRHMLHSDIDPIYGPRTPEQDGDDDLRNVTTYMVAKGNQKNSSAKGFELTSVSSFWCNLNFTAVHLNVTAYRPSRPNLGTVDMLPLTVKSYDKSTIIPILDQAPYKISQLNWTNFNWLSSFRAIYPTEGKNLLFYIMGLENPQFTYDDFVNSPKLLGDAGGRVLTHFAAEMVNIGRPYVQPMSQTQAKAASAVPATVATTQLRLIQSKSTTIALQVLLGCVLIVIIMAIFLVDTKVGIMKPPNSIGAQAGLFAGSELVKIAREQQLSREVSGGTAYKRSGWTEFNVDDGEAAPTRTFGYRLTSWLRPGSAFSPLGASRGRRTAVLTSSKHDQLAIWDGYSVSLGWWEKRVNKDISGSVSRRYGIDVGVADDKNGLRML